jgi:hypothetical protein
MPAADPVDLPVVGRALMAAQQQVVALVGVTR